MKVMVTGAAGRLGSEVCKSLLAGQHDVIALDRRGRDDLGVKVQIVDLRDRHAVEAAAASGGAPGSGGGEKLDAVVHLGNHVDFDVPDAQMIFGENMTMNINVLQSAVDHGARKMVFASSIQTVHSVPRLPAYDFNEAPAALPLDEHTPLFPTNPYALSKFCGEAMVAYYARVFGVQGVALRLPWLVHMTQFPVLGLGWQESTPFARQLAFGYLTYADGGRLVAAILAADLPGFRAYLPASRRNLLGRPGRDLVEEFFPGVPLRRTIDGDSLVDISTIQRETGWSPLD